MQRRAEMELNQETMEQSFTKTRSKKCLNTKDNTTINNINIQINTGNIRDNIINTTKGTKSKNFTTNDSD